MDYLVDESGNRLVDDFGNYLVTDAGTAVALPLTLMLRLRLHAVLFWGTILLGQLVPL
jgi:hypothetical protein